MKTYNTLNIETIISRCSCFVFSIVIFFSLGNSYSLLSIEEFPISQQNIFLSRMLLAKNPLFVAYQARNRVYILSYDPTYVKKKLTLFETTEDILKRESLQSWSTWIETGSPGYLIKIVFEFDIEKKKAIISSSEASNNLLYELISASFQEIPMHERRKRGGHLLDNESIDRRQIWHPPVFYKGQKIESLPSKAYITSLNIDENFQRKKFIVYFADSLSNVPEPFQAFPSWIESQGRTLLVLRSIESGFILSTE